MDLQSHWYIAGDTVSHSRRFDCWTARCENMKSCTAVGFSILCPLYIESKLKCTFRNVQIWRLLTSNAQMDNFIIVIVTVGNGVNVLSVLLACDDALSDEYFLTFCRIIGNHSTQWRMVTSQKYGVLNHTAFKIPTVDVNVITNGRCRYSTVRIVT